MTLFADDSTLTIESKSRINYENDINNALKSVILWLNRNNLKINIEKTKIIHFRQRLSPPNVDINFENNSLSEVKSTKYLGLIIDNKLNWKEQIVNMCKKLSSSAYALRKLAPILNIDALVTAYHGIVGSYLRYGIIFWGNSTYRELAFRAQKKCLRAMLQIPSDESCRPFFIKYKILTCPSLYVLETALFVKANPQLYLRQSALVKRSRRDDDIVIVPRANTALMRKGILCMAPKIYNKIPKNIRDLKYELFKKTLKKYLVEKCLYSLNEFS